MFPVSQHVVPVLIAATGDKEIILLPETSSWLIFLVPCSSSKVQCHMLADWDRRIVLTCG